MMNVKTLTVCGAVMLGLGVSIQADEPGEACFYETPLAISNGSFEQPDVNEVPGIVGQLGSWGVYTNNEVPGWTAKPGGIEIHSTLYGHGGANGTSQYSELGGRGKFQWLTFDHPEGAVLHYSFYHRARVGRDATVTYLLGPTGSANLANPTAQRTVRPSTHSREGWKKYEGYIVTYPGVTTSRFVFRTVKTGNNGPQGNLLDEVTINVVNQDVTPPTIECNVFDVAPNELPTSFQAVAYDDVSAASVTTTSVLAYAVKKNGKVIDKTADLEYLADGDLLAILGGVGVGTTIEWTLRAVDECGNESVKTCTFNIVKPGVGSQANEGLGNGVDDNTPGHAHNGGNDDSGFEPGNPGARNK